MEAERLVYREEVVAILIALADINVRLATIIAICWRMTMAKKKKGPTPEQRAKWEANQARLERIIERALAEEAARTPAAPKNARS